MYASGSVAGPTEDCSTVWVLVYGVASGSFWSRTTLHRIAYFRGSIIRIEMHGAVNMSIQHVSVSGYYLVFE